LVCLFLAILICFASLFHMLYFVMLGSGPSSE
jgi:hypothetical protein